MSGRRDVEAELDDRPGSLAELGEALGAAGVSLEGGGVFTTSGVAVAHFLVADAEAARTALEMAGIGPVAVHDVVTLALDQDVPGQLGLVARRLADLEVNILVQYSDHEGHLVLVVPDEHYTAAVSMAEAWGR